MNLFIFQPPSHKQAKCVVDSSRVFHHPDVASKGNLVGTAAIALCHNIVQMKKGILLLLLHIMATLIVSEDIMAAVYIPSFDMFLLNQNETAAATHIREQKLLQLLLWKMVHFALFLVKISINFSPVIVQYLSPSQWMYLLYKNFKTLVQWFNQ
jgi:hypothetical protein